MTKANITTPLSSTPVILNPNLTESFISAQRSGFLQAWTTLEGTCDNQDLVDSYFDESDEEFDTSGPTEQCIQLPDVIAIVERGINAGVIDCPVNQLDKIEYDSEPEELQPVPIPLIRLETAIHYTGELARFLQALETTTLPFPMRCGNTKSSTTPVDQLVSSMQDLNSALTR